MDEHEIDSLFEFRAEVGEQIDDFGPLEDLGKAAAEFARKLFRILPSTRARRAVVTKLVAVVDTAAGFLRESAAKKDRGLALSARAEAQIP